MASGSPPGNTSPDDARVTFKVARPPLSLVNQTSACSAMPRSPSLVCPRPSRMRQP